MRNENGRRCDAAALAMLIAIAVLVVAARSDAGGRCGSGLYLVGSTTVLDGSRVSRFAITSKQPRTLVLYGDRGACEGVVRVRRRHLRARLDSCLADAGGPSPSCWCSPTIVKLSFSSGCAGLHGGIRSRGTRHSLVAVAGSCGDGFLDADRGEDCDGETRPFGCFPGDQTCCSGSDGCDDACHCVRAASNQRHSDR